jgi:hypothetical protein
VCGVSFRSNRGFDNRQHSALFLFLRFCRRAFDKRLQHKLCRTWTKPALTRRFTTKNPKQGCITRAHDLGAPPPASRRSRLRRVTRRVVKILSPQQSAHVQGRTPVAIMPHAQFRAKRQPLLLLLIQRAPPCRAHPAPKNASSLSLFSCTPCSTLLLRHDAAVDANGMD